MNDRSSHESGQALVILVFAIVAIIGVVALAVDGSNVFAERRRAQNAADTAALAAALAKVAYQDWHHAGMDRALSNGFTNDGLSNTVVVVNPPAEGCGGVGGPYTGDDRYIQVVINTTTGTYFGGVIGVNEVQSCVEAIALAEPGMHIPLFYGNAVASTACHGDSTINAQGSAAVETIGGGAFSNSDSSQALTINWPDNLVTPADKGVTSVGGSVIKHGTYPSQIEQGARQFSCPLPDYMLPAYTCDYEYGDFPPAGTTNLDPGVYCISGDFTRTDGLTGIGVTFVMLNKGLKWNGNASMTLAAPDNGVTKGLLIYLPPSNSSEITLNGTANLTLVGTIFAPESSIKISGDFGGVALRTQLVGKTVDFLGDANLIIQFDETVSYEFPNPPTIELTK